VRAPPGLRQNQAVSGAAEEDGAEEGPSNGREPFDVSLIASNLPFVLRTFVGMAILVITSAPSC